MVAPRGDIENKSGPPWQESHRRLRGVVDWEIESRNRIQREVLLNYGKLECWDRDRRHMGGRMTLCGRQRI